jgi:hypothetical protein
LGKKEEALRQLLGGQADVQAQRIARPSREDILASRYLHLVVDMYRRLGGVLEDFQLNLRSWDMNIGNVAVELDEQLHFNRFRLETLKSEVYAELPQFPLGAYQGFCARHEQACIRAGKHGGKWTSVSSENQFGLSPSRGDFFGAGPARWRQRAFYDFVKDLSPLIIGIPVVRLAVWDEVLAGGRLVQLVQLERLLSERSSEARAGIFALVQARTPNNQHVVSNQEGL